MLKTKGTLNDVSVKNKQSNPRIWRFLVQQNNANNIEELRLREFNYAIVPRSRASLQSTHANDNRGSTNCNISESFHCAIGPILGIAQLFGVLPLAGVRASTPFKLRFAKFSPRTFYAAFITGMILFMAILALIHMIRTLNAETFEMRDGIGAATAGAIFYGNSLLGTVIFFWLSPRWVSLQCDWRTMEQCIDSNASESPRLRWKFFIISFVVLFLAFIEHVLSIVNNVEGYEWGAENSTFRSFLQVYCLQSHDFAFETFEYNTFFGIYIFVVSKLATFTWNFTDLFIMLVSTGLAERYKCLNKKVKNNIVKRRSAIDWQETREDYAVLSFMVKRVDNDISPLILLSFANNLYFICLQLLNGLSRNGDSTLLSALYFFGSFAFLIGRTCAVTLLTARINDQSKVALPHLYNCSSTTYNSETQRLQYQLTTDDIALTGLRFFSITRNFMLAVCGAIITYEVVLLQSNISINK